MKRSTDFSTRQKKNIEGDETHGNNCTNARLWKSFVILCWWCVIVYLIENRKKKQLMENVHLFDSNQSQHPKNKLKCRCTVKLNLMTIRKERGRIKRNNLYPQL